MPDPVIGKAITDLTVGEPAVLMSEAHYNALLTHLAQLQAVRDAAAQLAKEFHEMHEEQRQKLIIGQTLESAAKNWETLGKTMDMQPLLDALSRCP